MSVFSYLCVEVTRPIEETIEDALHLLLEVGDQMGRDSGLTGLDEFRNIL